MRRLFFITHADVAIAPDVPVPDWSFRRGARAARVVFGGGVCARDHGGLFQRRAEGAGWCMNLAAARGCALEAVEDLHQNDQIATGFLPKEEFVAVADAFFASPDMSVRGWETARDAQARIVGAVTRIAAADTGAGDIAIVGLGDVNALSCDWG